MLKIDKDIFLNIANHLTLCISIITLCFLVRMVNTDYSNRVTEIQQSGRYSADHRRSLLPPPSRGQFLLEKLWQEGN